MDTPPLPRQHFMHTALQNKDQPEGREITWTGLLFLLQERLLSGSEGGRTQITRGQGLGLLASPPRWGAGPGCSAWPTA